jgi:hypothetical protein
MHAVVTYTELLAPLLLEAAIRHAAQFLNLVNTDATQLGLGQATQEELLAV